MATKKTKNTRNAVEYIDSAGVKLNNNADLIIEANKAGDVISARNLLNGNEYVGGSGVVSIINVGLNDNQTINLNTTSTFEEVSEAYATGNLLIMKINDASGYDAIGTISPNTILNGTITEFLGISINISVADEAFMVQNISWNNTDITYQTGFYTLTPAN